MNFPRRRSSAPFTALGARISDLERLARRLRFSSSSLSSMARFSIEAVFLNGAAAFADSIGSVRETAGEKV
ncbi:hypothetical protein [Bartonella schoenbuchensis]|uniref:Uncharacterized protein n=1 Tax=Bartonella schoenbuchensis (strain DSM 13525 / NCTC 13165 / R1) TaxID=687861 RepID=A0A1S6XN59_BARSR|nr:hypothetical protein BscR1v2_001430 [Bartonella schoenbuchensis R1]